MLCLINVEKHIVVYFFKLNVMLIDFMFIIVRVIYIEIFCVFNLFLLRGSDYKFYIRSSFALLSWILSRVLGASVGFCVSGFNSLKDVELKFKKVLLYFCSLS